MAKIAVIGATGAVGREMLKELESRLPSLSGDQVLPLASSRSAGQMLPFAGGHLEVRAFDEKSAQGCEFALMSAGGSFSKMWAESLGKNGCRVIDNSSAWRMDDEVPLVVPEVNGSELDEELAKGIIANPNCSTIQLVVALEPLKRSFGIESVQVSTYQSVSGSGQQGLGELDGQIRAYSQNQSIEPGLYPQQILGNVLPFNGEFDAGGHGEEESKLVSETRKILKLSNLDVLATAVRVPVFRCHGEAVHIRLNKEISREEAIEAFKSFEGLSVVDSTEAEEIPTPLMVENSSDVRVSRIRLPLGQKKSRWLQFWVIADNLKKGAATNAVQILERLL